jgi:hypothetical protein
MSELSEALERQLRKIQLPNAPPLPVVAKTAENAPSDKQVSFFKDLVARKQLTDAQRTQLLSGLSVLDKQAISSTIQWLTALPWMPRLVQAPTQQKQAWGNGIPQGCYAITNPTGNLEFYKVSRPTEGKWVGYVFLSQLSGENHVPVRDRQMKDRVYAEIQKDVLGALKRFGKEIGQCGHCRKQLTDQESREFGIGPVCRKALGL